MSLIPNKHHGCYVFMVFVLLVCSSCATKTFQAVTPVRSHWNVELQFDPTVPAEIQDNINIAFDNFTIYSHTRPAIFDWSQDTTETDMIIHVRAYQPVRPGQQVAGVIISLIGLSTPVLMASAQIPFVITFWYFPKTRSISEMHVRDASGIHSRRHLIVAPGFLKNSQMQGRRHASAYGAYFRVMGRFYEKQLKNARRKGLATTN
jgi:hypothetical protein